MGLYLVFYCKRFQPHEAGTEVTGTIGGLPALMCPSFWVPVTPWCHGAVFRREGQLGLRKHCWIIEDIYFCNKLVFWGLGGALDDS